jgi:hypothetical protein
LLFGFVLLLFFFFLILFLFFLILFFLFFVFFFLFLLGFLFLLEAGRSGVASAIGQTETSLAVQAHALGGSLLGVSENTVISINNHTLVALENFEGLGAFRARNFVRDSIARLALRAFVNFLLGAFFAVENEATATGLGLERRFADRDRGVTITENIITQTSFAFVLVGRAARITIHHRRIARVAGQVTAVIEQLGRAATSDALLGLSLGATDAVLLLIVGHIGVARATFVTALDVRATGTGGSVADREHVIG